MLNREDKWNGCGAELQNFLYFGKFWASNQNSKEFKETVCPAVLFNVIGTDLTIYGAVFTELGMVMDFYLSTTTVNIPSDNNIRTNLARAMMALRLVKDDLEEYYQNILPNPQAIQGWPHLPIGNQFQYIRRIDQSLAFEATMEKKPVIVKFTRQYCQEAHKSCPLAPQLISCKRVKYISLNY
jgi:hypothetical protein